MITQHFDCMLHSSLSKALACERLQELHLISLVGQYVYMYHANGMFWNFSEILGQSPVGSACGQASAVPYSARQQGTAACMVHSLHQCLDPAETRQP